MDPSLAIAVPATIALLGLLWSIYIHRKKQPRIHVTLELHARGSLSLPARDPMPETEVEARITVLNTGELACTVLDVGLSDTNGATLVSAEQEQATSAPVKGGDVPYRIEGHGTNYWQVPADKVKAQIESGRRFLGYAKLARPQHWWLPPSRSQFKVFHSLHSEVRGTP